MYTTWSRNSTSTLPRTGRSVSGGILRPACGLADEPQGTARGFRIFFGARPDVVRNRTIRNECLDPYGGPFLLGAPTMADAMYAPVRTERPQGPSPGREIVAGGRVARR